MIQSRQSFNVAVYNSGPSDGDCFSWKHVPFMVCNADDSHSVELVGNLNPANGQYYGISAQQDTGLQIEAH